MNIVGNVSENHLTSFCCEGLVLQPDLISKLLFLCLEFCYRLSVCVCALVPVHAHLNTVVLIQFRYISTNWSCI